MEALQESLRRINELTELARVLPPSDPCFGSHATSLYHETNRLIEQVEGNAERIGEVGLFASRQGDSYLSYLAAHLHSRL